MLALHFWFPSVEEMQHAVRYYLTIRWPDPGTRSYSHIAGCRPQKGGIRRRERVAEDDDDLEQAHNSPFNGWPSRSGLVIINGQASTRNPYHGATFCGKPSPASAPQSTSSALPTSEANYCNHRLIMVTVDKVSVATFCHFAMVCEAAISRAENQGRDMQHLFLVKDRRWR